MYRLLFFFLILALILQVALAVHASQTGKDKFWVGVILMLPVVGSIAYISIELWPELDFGAVRSALGLTGRPDPDAEVLRRLAALDSDDTVENRQELARAYMRAKRFKEAEREYSVCRSRGYERDGAILLESAYALFFQKRFEGSRDLLSAMEKDAPDHDPAKRELLIGRVLDGLGATEEATARLEAIAAGFPTLEARCRLALLYKKGGRVEDAERSFQAIVAEAETYHPDRFAEEMKWYEIARANLS